MAPALLQIWTTWISKLNNRDNIIYLIMLLFSIASAMFLPVVQSFLFQNVCLGYRDGDETKCVLRQAAEDPDIHSQTNYIMMLGSVCMCGVALYTASKVSAYSDTRRRIAIVIPLAGALVADVIFIVMSFLSFEISPYFFVVAELTYGLTGGYMAAHSTIISYLCCMKINRESPKRSVAMARMEGVIGLGAVLGNLLGVLASVLPYSTTFGFFVLIHTACIILVFQLDGEKTETAGVEMDVMQQPGESSAPPEQTTKTGTNWLIVLLYATFTISFFSMIGSSHILFFYFKQIFFWDIMGLSVYTGIIRFGSTSAAFFLYPWLKNAGNCSDSMLAVFGLTARIFAKLWMAIALSPVILYGAIFFEFFGRFPATALRAMISVNTDLSRQGQAFGIIALLEAWCNLFAAIFFHVVFPWSLTFLPQLSFVLISIVLIPPTILIWVFGPRLDAPGPPDQVENH